MTANSSLTSDTYISPVPERSVERSGPRLRAGSDRVVLGQSGSEVPTHLSSHRTRAVQPVRPRCRCVTSNRVIRFWRHRRVRVGWRGGRIVLVTSYARPDRGGVDGLFQWGLVAR